MNFPTIPNPWIILGVLVALIGAYFAGDYHGIHAERLAWTAKEQTLIAQNTQKAREAENASAALNAETERQYLNEKAKSDDLGAKLAAAARTHGMRDPKGTCQQPVPTVSTPAGNPPDGAAGCQLSPGLSDDLWNLAGRADAAALYAQAGHGYAIGH